VTSVGERTSCPVQRLGEVQGKKLGTSRWREITQQAVSAFGAATGDEQWIHTDPERAASGPFGGTVAHGYMTLAMFTGMLSDVLEVTGISLVLNKGVDKLRFSAPVPVGGRVAADIEVIAVRPRPRGFYEVRYGLSVRVEGQPTAALAAEAIFLYQQG
jgi:acyl dehydratase